MYEFNAYLQTLLLHVAVISNMTRLYQIFSRWINTNSSTPIFRVQIFIITSDCVIFFFIINGLIYDETINHFPSTSRFWSFIKVNVGKHDKHSFRISWLNLQIIQTIFSLTKVLLNRFKMRLLELSTDPKPPLYSMCNCWCWHPISFSILANKWLENSVPSSDLQHL